MDFYDRDDSGVLDFHRSLRRTIDELPADAPLRACLAAPGTASGRDDSDDGDDDSDAADDDDEQEPGMFTGARLLEHLPDFPPEEEPPPVLHLAPAPPETVEAQTRLSMQAATLLELAPDEAPLEIVTCIEAFVIRMRRLRRTISSDDANLLAVLWGDCVCRVTDWTWNTLDHGPRQTIGIGSRDGRYAVDVVPMFRDQLGASDVTLIALFNAIRARNLPEPVSNGAVTVTVRRIVPRY